MEELDRLAMKVLLFNNSIDEDLQRLKDLREVGTVGTGKFGAY